VLYLTREDLEPLVSMAEAVQVLDRAFATWGEVGSFNMERRRGQAGDGQLAHILAGGIKGGVFGVRTTGSVDNTIFLISENEGPLAVLDCDPISRTRTGAASGLATKYLAREDSKVVGIIGGGRTAFPQLEAVCAVRKIERIKVFTRTEETRNKFAEKSAERLKVTVEPVGSAEECIRGSDIVITATKSPTPVFDGRWLARGTHVNGMGANSINRREVDDATVLGSAIVVTDHRNQAKIEAGALSELVKAGKLTWEQVAELGDVVRGKSPRRTNADQITFFHSLGIGFEDTAYAVHLLDKAKKAGVGKKTI
jgi:ornithine cyclodeaminase